MDASHRDSAYNRRLSRAKLLGFLDKREAGSVCAEQNIYGSAIALPQFARSLEWPVSLQRSVIRGYFFLALNIYVQASLLYYVSKEDQVVSKFGGQMHLCNFGANMANCPDAPGCVGPSGTRYTYSRLYSFAAIVDRQFVKDSLLQVFPEHADSIRKHVDVGEYGLESSSCRLLCVFLFMIEMISEFFTIYDMLALLYSVPTADESWVTYEVPSWEAKERVKEIKGWSELDLVQMKVAGMPMRWKIINVVFVVTPKIILWKCLCEVGVSFLMETSAMDDLIVNSVALGFILSIDEVFFQTLTKDSVRYMMMSLQAYDLYDTSALELYSDEQALERDAETHKSGWTCRKFLDLVPLRLVVAMAWTVVFVSEYYRRHCQVGKDGTMISKAVYIPQSFSISIFRVFFPRFFPADLEDEAAWEPPDTA
jgi:hypothetical protein